MDILSVFNLTFQIDNKMVIDDLNLSIRQKSLNAVLSSNNSCKTTLIKILSGIINHNCGKISVNNIVLNKKNFKKYIVNISTILSDIDNQFICDNVEDEIKNPLYNLKYLKKDLKKQYNYVIKLLNIEYLEEKEINELTYLDKIKVLIATSIIHKPKVLFIDDIFRFLKIEEKEEIINLLKLIVEDLHTAVLFTTSNLLDVKDVDNIYVLKDGKIFLNDSFNNIILKDNELSKIGIEIPLMIDLSRKLEFYGLINEIYYDRDEVIDKLWK